MDTFLKSLKSCKFFFTNFNKRKWLGNIDFFIFLLSIVLAFEIFSIRGNVDLGLGDEGYLWYGADRVFHGEVPIRDFESYAPGRYYWSAFFFKLWKPGLICLRLSESVFQAFGLFFGLLAAKRFTHNRWELAAIGLVLALWMYPEYKVFDCAIPIMAVFAGLKISESPSWIVCWFAGFLMSLGLFVGLNHGLYLFVSVPIILLVNSKKIKISRWGAVGIGMAVGFIPYIRLFLFSKDFFPAFFKEFLRVKERGDNVHVPVPWPWTVHWSTGWDSYSFAAYLFGVLFLVVPIFYLFNIYSRFYPLEKIKTVNQFNLICATIGLVYLHYAFSRADYQHLAVALSPFWLSFFGYEQASPSWRKVRIFLGVVISILSIGVQAQWIQYFNSQQYGWVERPIGEDKILMNPKTAMAIDGAQEIVGQLKSGENILFLPHLPSLYAVFGLKSPIWATYVIFPLLSWEQEQAIQEMERNNVVWAVIDNEPLDGQNDLSFQNENPQFWKYLMEHFQIARKNYLFWDCYLLRRNDTERKSPSP